MKTKRRRRTTKRPVPQFLSVLFRGNGEQLHRLWMRGGGSISIDEQAHVSGIAPGCYNVHHPKGPRYATHAVFRTRQGHCVVVSVGHFPPCRLSICDTGARALRMRSSKVGLLGYLRLEKRDEQR